jgi:tetratricopeptide (TPR) repeat protein
VRIRRANTLAEANLQVARKAVDELLLSAGGEQTQVAEEVPQLEEFRRELLVHAKDIYSIFITQKPGNQALRKQNADTYFGLGEIDRLLHEPQAAAQEYQQAIAELESLAKDYPREADYRQALANAYNWLGETLRIQPDRHRDADKAYEAALRLQQRLMEQYPDNGQYGRELARTHSNRGILRYDNRDFGGSESEFRAAVRLLAPLAGKDPYSPAAQELARAYNNLGILLTSQKRNLEAAELDQKAIGIYEELVKQKPDNREYQEELATLRTNLAILMMSQSQSAPAVEEVGRAVDLMEDLARPAPSLGMQLAKAHSLRCQLLASEDVQKAGLECHDAMDLLSTLEKVPSLRGMPDFQKLYRDLGYNYRDLSETHLKAGEVAQAQSNLASLSRLLPEISQPYQSSLMKDYRELQAQLSTTARAPQKGKK